MKYFQLSTLVVSTLSQGTTALTSRTNRIRYSQLNEALAISRSQQGSKATLLDRHIIASQPRQKIKI